MNKQTNQQIHEKGRRKIILYSAKVIYVNVNIFSWNFFKGSFF